MTADQMVAILKSRGCEPSDLRDGVHEAVHVLQTGSRSWDREKLHETLERKAWKTSSARNHIATMVRYELQARAVEMLACKHFKIPYDIDHWAFTCWMETSKSYRVDIGSIDKIVDSVRIVSKQVEVGMLLRRVLSLRARREPRA